ncbi:MAG: tripartite tricarboxylate transporter substrate binding protein BugD [Rhizobiales bacterium]|nr:tripartite tricarboxylate transporter substrate binding protein BugD [Hyphomicrobiales bacterium]
MTRILVPIIALAAALASTVSANAQSYPSRPIMIVVGFPPGGPTDTVARVMAENLEKSLGQPVVIENVGGASGSIAGARVARAAPDGYTLNVGQWTTQVGAGGTLALQYHVMNDFEPVAQLTTSYLWILGRKDLPAKSVAELVAWLKANPGKSTAATVGFGSAAHMCLVDFQNKSGTQFQFVPYRGGAPVMQDLLGGQVDFSCLEASQTMPHYKSGKLNVFGVASKDRWFGAKDVPTLAEGGVPGVEIQFWHGLWAPKNTPNDIVAKLNAAVLKAFGDPKVQQRFANLGHVIPPRDQLTPAALAKHHKAEIDKWWPIMKAAGIKPAASR